MALMGLVDVHVLSSSSSSSSFSSSSVSLCFFTMSNSKSITWARRLVSSGDIVGRPIWYYRIPSDHPDPKRYKLELLMGDKLPYADKYIYLDADTIMVQRGDWESAECMGARPETFKQRARHWFADEKGYRSFCKLAELYGHPQRVNTGCVVLPNAIRKQVAERWLKWCEMIDTLCEEPTPVRDQMHFAFVRQDFDLPFLADRFNVLIKSGECTENAVLLHASGKPHGDGIKPYHDAVKDILGGFLDQIKETQMGYRWQVITNLILRYAANPTFPVGAEVGVDVGENAEHLLRAFPGLKLYCIDNWSRGAKRYTTWCNVREKYSDRVIELKCLSDEPVLNEQLDFVFLDADHRTEQVIRDIKHWLPQVKPGGVMIGHDIDHKSKTGSTASVRAAVTSIFDKFDTGPDYTWWVRKN